MMNARSVGEIFKGTLPILSPQHSLDSLETERGGNTSASSIIFRHDATVNLLDGIPEPFLRFSELTRLQAGVASMAVILAKYFNEESGVRVEAVK